MLQNGCASSLSSSSQKTESLHAHPIWKHTRKGILKDTIWPSKDNTPQTPNSLRLRNIINVHHCSKKKKKKKERKKERKKKVFYHL